MGELQELAERLERVCREYSREASRFMARTEAEGKYAGRLCGLAFAAAEFARRVREEHRAMAQSETAKRGAV